MIIEYQSDEERKRVDYLLNRHWKDHCTKPKGMAVCFSDDDRNKIDEFLGALYPRLELGEKSVRIFSGEYTPSSKQNTQNIISLSYNTTDDFIVVERLIKYILDKFCNKDPDEDEGYRQKHRVAATKKGVVNIDISVTENKSTDIDIILRGYNDAVTLIRDRIEREFMVLQWTKITEADNEEYGDV